MTTILAFLRDWIPYLLVLSFGTTLIATCDRPAAAENGDDLPNGSDPRCAAQFWDTAEYYCYESIWGYETDYWIPAVEVVDNGEFGFTMLSEAYGTADNVHAVVLFEWGYFRLQGDVGGATFTIPLVGTCDYHIFFDWPQPCGYWPTGIQLGEGWVLANGLDLSGTWLEAAEQLYPPFVGGGGSEYPPYPYDPEDPPAVGLSHAYTDPVYEFPVEDYFGITVRIHTGSEETLATVPEPSLPLALMMGSLGLGLVAHRRQR